MENLCKMWQMLTLHEVIVLIVVTNLCLADALQFPLAQK